MGSPQNKKAQSEITAAAAVAQFLGITVSPSANSCQVAQVIQAVIDEQKRQNKNLKAANQLISEKYSQVLAQNTVLRESTRKAKDCPSTQTQANQETPEWGNKNSRHSRSRTQKQGEEAA